MSIDEIIKNSDLKLTSARKELLKILKNAKKPLSYEDMKSDISMDKATFYRNIIKFEEANLINSFESIDKKRYYELIKSPHAHFICTNCNKIECVDKSLNINLSNYLINDIMLKGICPNCH